MQNRKDQRTEKTEAPTLARPDIVPVIDGVPAGDEVTSFSEPTAEVRGRTERQPLAGFENKYSFCPTENGHLLRQVTPAGGSPGLTDRD